MHITLFCISTLLSVSLRVAGQTAYANDFVDPDFIVAGNFPANTGGAQTTITSWARKQASSGPWSVMDKAGAAPTGDKHDFLSFAPYWWPDCSGVGNTTALSDREIWTTCPYRRRDGLLNPDARDELNDVGHFQDMSEAVFYNTLAWAFTKTPSNEFSQNAVRFLRVWFLDQATRMNPHLNFAQMIRGPGREGGNPTGVLDLKGMAKIISAILILRKGQNTDWTAELDAGMVAWSREYIRWLETAEMALEEAAAVNNHGTFYYNQLGALKLLVGDTEGAVRATGTYFAGQFRSQIAADGEQPEEVKRTRPYHYRAYNLAAMITNARIEKYANPNSDVWNRTSSSGAGIKAALDHAMKFSASDSNEASYAAELYPNIAAVASVYGDPDSTYVNFLKQADNGFSVDPYFLWNQPFAPKEGRPLPSPKTTTTRRSSTATGSSSTTSGTPSTKKGSSSSSSPTDDLEENAALSRLAGSNFWFSMALSLLTLSAGLVMF